MLRFVYPSYLLLLIPALFFLVYSYRHVHGMMKGRKKLSFALRFLLVSSLIVALAGPEARRQNEGLCTIFLLDRSHSISDVDQAKQNSFVNAALKSMRDEDQSGVIVFGKEASIEMTPARYSDVGRILTKVDGAASDLASAIRLASASFPDGKARRIVLLSDGNETSGDAMEAAEVAAVDGIGIDHIVLGREAKDAEVSIVEAVLPNEISSGEPFDIRVQAHSNTSTRGILQVDRNGVIVKKTEVTLNPGMNNLVVSQQLDDPGFHRYRVTLQANRDRDNRNNVGAAFVAVRGKPRVLLVQQNPASSPLGDALKKQNIQADVHGPDGIPARPEDLQLYDAVIFNDVNAASMTERQMKLLQGAIRDTGIGFAMIGGEDSFLPGGWYGTPLAEVLPVDLDIRQRKSFPSTSICIVADCSGSMGMIEDGVKKIRLAAKAAEQTVMMMSPMDRVGVAGSHDQIDFVAPMQKLTDKDAVTSQVRRLYVGGGGIYVKPSLEFAYKHLKAEDSKVRHLILLADGADCDLLDGCLPLAALMRSEKITISVVSIGDGQFVPFLKQLAAMGGGQFYLAKRAAQLPAIFSQDTAIMSRSAIEEGTFLPKMAFGEEILRGIDKEGVPPLFAYCLTDSRPLARMGMRTHKDDPLLATWQYGLGTTLAFTSDAQARWAARWVAWGGFSQFWAQAVRSISRRASTNDYRVAAKHDGSRGVVEIKAFDSLGNPMNSLPAQVRVLTPTGSSRELALSQTAPGVYKGTFEAGELGSYIVAVAEEDASGGKRINTSGFSLPYPPEYRNYRSNEPLLTNVSKVSNGMALQQPAQAARPVSNPGFSIQELWSFFVLLAALLLPLDVAARRIALPIGEVLAKMMAKLRLRRAARSAATAVPAHVERLQSAKRKVTSGREEETTPAERVFVEEREPVGVASPGGDAKTASSRLLEAKKKRNEGK